MFFVGSIENAQSEQLFIPKTLQEKLTRDNRYAQQINTIIVPAQHSNAPQQLIGPAAEFTDDNYTIRADEELYTLVTKYPYLEDIDSWLKQGFGIAKFSKGKPTYEIGLECTVSASHDTIQSMTQLAQYFANACNGIIYDADNNTFGRPNSHNLHQEGMSLFFAAAKDANKKGFNVTPTDL